MKDFIYDEQFRVWHRAELENFAYSDGEEIEKYIYDVVSAAADKSSYSQELSAHIKDWPSEYHLSSVRQNLLRPFDFSNCKNILDLGCGCGAILRFWGETGAQVTGIEGSFSRAKVAAARCSDLPNVKVYVSNLMDFNSQEKFDVISLIGVLEYSPLFINSENPVRTCLQHCLNMLSDNGTLIVAIENQLGLKYLAGYPEDHVAKAFFGVQDLYTKETPVTFGKGDLKNRILKAGFEKVDFFYPFPDYKLPNVVVSEKGFNESKFNVPDLLLKTKNTFNGVEQVSIFEDSLVRGTLAKNGLGSELANSFLVFASKNKAGALADQWLAKYYTTPYKETPSYVQTFKIQGNRITVLKSVSSLEKNRCVAVREEDYVSGESYLQILKKILWRKGTQEDLVQWFRSWSDFLKSNLAEGGLLPKEFIDAIPHNLIVDSTGKISFIDNDTFVDSNSSIKSILVRGILHTLSQIKEYGILIGQTPRNIISNYLELIDFQISNEEIDKILLAEAEIQFVLEKQGSAKDYYERYLTFIDLPLLSGYEELDFQLRSSFEEINQDHSINNFLNKIYTELVKRYDLILENNNNIVALQKELKKTQDNLKQKEQLVVELYAELEKQNQLIQVKEQELKSLEHRLFKAGHRVRYSVGLLKKALKHPDKKALLKKGYHYIAAKLPLPLKNGIKKSVKCFLKLLTGKDLNKADIKNYFKTVTKSLFEISVYEQWYNDNFGLTNEDLQKIITACNAFEWHPKFSIVINVEDKKLRKLRSTILSITKQTYDSWNSIILVNEASRAKIEKIVTELNCEKQVMVVSKSKTTVADYNEIINLPEVGQFISFVNAGDRFREQAFYLIARVCNKSRGVSAIYFDEDIINTKGQRYNPTFKPDLNFDYLISKNYIGDAAFYNVGALKRFGGFNAKFSYQYHWELLLKLALQHPKAIEHIAIPIFSKVKRKQNRKIFLKEGELVLSDYCNLINDKNVNLHAKVVYEDNLPAIRYKIKTEEPLVSIIIPTRDCVDLLRVCLTGIFTKTDYKNYEIIIVDNGSVKEETLSFFATLANKQNLRIIRDDSPFNYSALNNLAANNANGEFLLLMNNDLEIVDRNWLNEVVAEGLRDNVASVAPLLLYPNGKIQHAGVILGPHGLATHVFAGCELTNKTYQKYGAFRRNYSALSAACLLVRKRLFDAVDGLDEEHLAVAFNDVDLTLKLQKLGYRNVFTPYAKVIHHESASRGEDNVNHEKMLRCAKEAAFVQKKWKFLIANDPAYNQNLTFNANDFAIAQQTRVEKSWLADYNRCGFSSFELREPLNIYGDQSNLDRIREVQKGTSPLYQEKQLQKGLSVLIVTKDAPELIIPLLKQLIQQKKAFETAHCFYEIIIGDTGTTNEEVLSFYKTVAGQVLIKMGLKYQFSRCNNLLQREASGDAVLLLNNDIILPPNEKLLFDAYSKLIEDKELGCLGAVLYYPDGTIQHMGCEFLKQPDIFGLPYHVNHRQKIIASDIPQEKRYPTVTGAFLMVRNELYSFVNGLDEHYQSECQDAAFCLELSRLGYYSKCFNLGHIIHIENATRPKGDENWADRRRFLRKYLSYIELYLKNYQN
ncbi:MAG: glycosyltransferase [Bdellovibrionota bacterium]|jgi:GT2 family glycosyltransferase/2-polyprenyl-3-methyl-5-hydroxy-6-metoxy-1,4-benzoquinol methylase